MSMNGPGSDDGPDTVGTPGPPAAPIEAAAWREVMSELAHLRAEVAQLRGEVAAGGTPPGTLGGQPTPDADPRWSRRGVLLGALGAAAGATAAVAGASPAAAGVGAMQFGATNVADGSGTTLTSTSGFQTFTVANTGAGNGVHARATGAGAAALATAAGGPAVRAESTGGNGIEGRSTSQLGVLGESPEGAGVEGRGATFGVVGRTNGGTAVFGFSRDRTGVEGVSNGGGAGLNASSFSGPAGQFRSSSGPTLRLSNGRTGVPIDGTWVAGDIVAAQTLSGRLELWVCVAGGTPGTWRQLAGPTVAGGFVPIQPVRVYDSRWVAVPGVVTGILEPDTTRTVSVADGRNSLGKVTEPNAVPPGTTAVTLNVTVVGTVGRGNLALVPNARQGSNTSSINWSADNQVLANGLTLAINSFARTLDIICRSNRTHALVDITGYYSGA
ncbi:MAG: hypothetical protein QG597_354 [Actinomycetota bacterium]|nr:hypothetical protein [Actinomycetota bacterium]